MDDSNITGRAKGGKSGLRFFLPKSAKNRSQGSYCSVGEKLLQALHTGNFKEHFGIDVDCYVLNDTAKTAVISQRGMAQAIGFSKRGDRLTVFAGSKTMEDYLGRI